MSGGGGGLGFAAFGADEFHDGALAGVLCFECCTALGEDEAVGGEGGEEGEGDGCE